MANVKISELTAITSSSDLADADIIPLVDSSDSTTKRAALSVLNDFWTSSVWCTGTNTAYNLTDCIGIGTATPGTDIILRAQGDSCFTGDLKIGGDVCIGGDDLFMGTNTSGYMMVADGTNFNPVAMSGDVGIDSSGATTIGTICNKILASPVLCGTITGNAFLDEDNMASDSASKVASQQSIKTYVDSVASGLDLKCSSHAATTANLSADYSNGSSGVGATLTNNSTQSAFSVDGQTMAADERVLIKDQSTAAQNGIYTVSTVGDGSTNWVLTRATDFDTSTEITSGAFTFVETGSSYADSGWVMTTDGTVTVGTTALSWTQFSGAGQITAGDGLTKSGNTLNVGAGSNLLVNTDAVAICSIVTGLTTVCTTNLNSSSVYIGGTTSANQLDNYVEGTFTPAYTAGSGSITLSTADGYYTRIGNLIYVTIKMIASDVSSPSGTLVISGLPVASANNTGGEGVGAVIHKNLVIQTSRTSPYVPFELTGGGTDNIPITSVRAHAVVRVVANSTTAKLSYVDNDVSYTDAVASDIAADTEIHASFFYQA